MLRLDPNKGLLTFPSDDPSSDPSSPASHLDKYVEALAPFRRVPGSLKDYFELLESDSEFMTLPPDMLVLFESLKGIKTTFFRSMFSTILEWFATTFSQIPLPISSDEVVWNGCPYGSNVLDIYKCFGGDTEDLFLQCLAHAQNCKNSKSKKKVPLPSEPTTVSLVTPVKQPYLSEKANVEAPTASSSISAKSDPGRLPDSSVPGGVNNSNLDGLFGLDRPEKSPEVVADDESFDWFKILSFAQEEHYLRVLTYLDNFYQIPRSFKVRRVDSSNVNKINDLVRKFMNEPTTSKANSILIKAKFLSTEGADPETLFLSLLQAIAGTEDLKNSNALINQYRSRVVDVDLRNNGYVLLAYWICVDYYMFFGEYDYSTPDQLVLNNKETIFAFWNRVVRQSHLFGTVKDDEYSYAKCYKKFIDGLPDPIRSFVREELERNYQFDNPEVRTYLPKHRGVMHLRRWTTGMAGSISVEKSTAWLLWNKPSLQKWLLNESKKEETASSSHRKNRDSSSSSVNAKSGLYSHKPSPKDKGGFSRSSAKAASYTSETSASASSSAPPPSSSSASSSTTETKDSTHRDQHRGKKKKN